jgi:integrase
MMPPEDGGNPVRLPFGMSQTELVQLAALLAQHLAAAATPAVKPIPFRQFRDELLALYAPPLRAKATHAKLRLALEVVGDLIAKGIAEGTAKGTTEDLTPALVAKFVTERSAGRSSVTVDSLLQALSRVCNYAVDRGYLRISPFASRGYRQWTVPTPPLHLRKTHHSAEEIARVLDLARETIGRKSSGSPAQWRARRLYALVATIAYTGLRRNEALWLRVEDLDLDAGVLSVVARRQLKTAAAAATVPIPDTLVAILRDWLPHLALPKGMAEYAGDDAFTPASNPTRRRDPGWVFPNAYRTGPWCGGPPGQKPLDRLARLGVRAGVEGFTFHSLRHSWATHAESRWGFSEAMIQRVLRHTSKNTQQTYRHADVPNLREKVQGLGFGGASEADPLPATEPAAEAEAVPDPDDSKPGYARGTRCANARLDEPKVIEARRLKREGWSYAKLAVRYGVSENAIFCAVTGKTWWHVREGLGPA